VGNYSKETIIVSIVEIVACFQKETLANNVAKESFGTVGVPIAVVTWVDTSFKEGIVC
jgi:hypothetical protein